MDLSLFPSSGTIGTAVRGFAKPIAVSGTVQIMPRSSTWRPGWTHVLRMDDAARNRDGKPAYVYLAVSIEDGRIVGMTSATGPTGKAPVQFDFQKVRVEKGRLVGTVSAVFRPDLWQSALTETNPAPRAAATYTLDVDLAKQQDAGAYTGTWGVDWSTELPLSGKMRQEASR